MTCHVLRETCDSRCFDFVFRKPSVDWFRQCCPEHRCFLVDACMPAMLEFAQRHANSTVAIFDISKALARLLIVLNDERMVLRESDEERLFDFVCKFWDYASEAVCYACANIFESLMRMHRIKCKSTDESPNLSRWAKNIGKFLADSPSSCRVRYRCILTYHKIFTPLTESFIDEFCQRLYSLLSNPSLVGVVCELITFDIAKNFADSRRRQLHSNLLHASLQSPLKAVRCAVQERLLKEFSRNPVLLDWVIGEFEKFLEGNSLDKMYPIEMSLFAAKFCVFHQKGNGNMQDWTSFINEHIVIAALLNADVQIRLMAWNLICDHPKLLAPISNRQLLLCKCFLATNMAEQSPAIRLSILSGLKKILIRVREIGQNILKNGGNIEDRGLKPYADFICSLRNLCFESLLEYANFSRRIMALRMLEYLFVENCLSDSNKGLLFKSLLPKLRPTSYQIRRIICCLDDSYQLCQISALRLLASPLFKIDDFDFPSYLLETKEQMFCIRSLFTLTSGFRLRFYLQRNPDELQVIFQYLIETCRERLKLISKDFLLIATNKGFVYSVLNAIAVVLEILDLQSDETDNHWCITLINDVLLSMCFEISDLVAPVVNSMSPEGFVPDDHIKVIVNAKNFETLKESTDFCQVLLASCWRSHKYVSAIFHEIVTKLLGKCALSMETVHRISGYYWRQLTECKHCGAIETAIDGFEALCTKLWSFAVSGKSDFQDLPRPDNWMQQIITLLDDEKTTTMLCATRRSAGLPYLVISILATEPSINNGQCLKTAMISVLLDMEQKCYETQIHRINILRAVFSDSRLSEQILCYLESAMKFCFISFDSDFWAIRNAASQLFAVLLTRMFGVSRNMQRSLRPHQKNRLSSFEFFTRFPSLYDLLHQQFQQTEKSPSQLKLFAVLIHLTHLFPSPRHTNNIYSLRTYILPLLNVLLECRAMKLRELAAVALVSVCEIQDAHFLLKWLGAIDFSTCSQNEICSLLLLLIELAVTFGGDGCDNNIRISIHTVIKKIENQKYFERWCDYNRSLFLLLVLESDYQLTKSLSVMEKFIASDSVLVFRPLARYVAEKMEKDGKIPTEFHNLLTKNSTFRLEFWRVLSNLNTMGYIDAELIRIAVEDLRNSESYSQQIILTMFLNNATVAAAAAILETPLDIKRILQELIRTKKLRQNNRNLVYLLLVKLDPNNWCFEWLYNCAINDDQEIQWIAVQAVEILLEKGYSDVQLCKILVLLLQNENHVIREKIAQLCSHIISPKSAPLNPQIVLWWFLERYPELIEIIRQHGSFDSNEHAQLFDACVSNPYAEAIPIGNENLSDIQKLIL